MTDWAQRCARFNPLHFAPGGPALRVCLLGESSLIMKRLAHPPANPPTEEKLADVLQPSLRHALNSLSVQLDQELARYRYARRGEAPTAPTPQFRPRRRNLDLISVSARHSDGPSHPQPGTPPPLPPNPRIQREPAAHAATEAASDRQAAATPPLLNAAGAPQPIAPPSQDVVSTAAIAANPDGYMPSSEALLESLEALAGEGVAAPPEPSPAPWRARLSTPLGLGSLLLLLVASAGFGFVMVNPTAVQHLVNRESAAEPESPSDGDTSEASAILSEEGTLLGRQVPRGRSPLGELSPDLSQQEFVALNRSTLSTLPVESPSLNATTPPGSTPGDPAAPASSQPTPTSPLAGAQVVPAPSPTPLAVAPRPTPNPVTPPRPAAPAAPAQPAPQAPRPQPAAPSSAAPATPSGSSSSAPSRTTYYVVADYTGDPSLNEARTVVSDAYVRNFEIGARIQLGAFESQATANEFINDLAGQGINAQVYQR